MTTPTIGSDDSRRRAAVLLAAVSNDLSSRGATADTVVPHHLPEVPEQLAELLRGVVPLPDRTSGWSVVRGLLAGFGEPGPTPPDWGSANTPATRAFDIALTLIAMSLGTVFGWTGQQDGRLVHNIVPSQGAEHLQVGASSTTELAWHTEDAFHPDRASLLLLACVRNPDQVGSLVAGVRRTRLARQEVELLSSPNVTIVPDDSYPDDWQAGRSRLPRVPTTWWADDGLCVRYDPSYSRFPVADPRFDRAYRRLGHELARCGETVALAGGDLLLIDNDVAVHGRSAFTPRYDGTDRWLKRVLVRLPRARPAERHDGFAQRTVEPQRAGGAR
jgi:hypothetical protein